MSSGITDLVVLVLIILVVGIVGFAIWYFTRSMKNTGEKMQKAVLDTAIPGDAKIIRIDASAEGAAGMDVVLRLEVTPQFGESFNASTVWSVEPAHFAEIQVGKSISVKIAEIQAAKSKTKKFKSIFPDVAWAELYYWQDELTEETVKKFV
ncbi:MAG: hypothetical protein ABSA23_13505 [Anaerolineales bacterium]|jgi:hypothetical protein